MNSDDRVARGNSLADQVAKEAAQLLLAITALVDSMTHATTTPS